MKRRLRMAIAVRWQFKALIRRTQPVGRRAAAFRPGSTMEEVLNG